MVQRLDEVASAALSLPPEDREKLVEQLLDSLNEPDQPPVDAEWEAEIERRIDQIERGDTTLIPGEEVMAKLYSRFK